MKKFASTSRYQSSVISELKRRATEADKLKKSMHPITIDMGSVQVILPRSFGFCYGVENAIEITHKAIEENPDKRIFLLSELIHNQYINQYFLDKGVKFLMNTKYEPVYDLDDLKPEDIIIIPAFGAPVYIQEMLHQRGLSVEKYQTTCPFVVKVWNKGESLVEQGFTIVIHGTVGHEETESTRSRIAVLNAPYIIVKNPALAERLGYYIEQKGTQVAFEEEFKHCYSKGFDIHKDLQRIGVINQTTMIATETQSIMDTLKAKMQTHFGVEGEQLDAHFAKTRDTLCYATNDNQKALKHVLETLELDMAIAVGGSNSSNTSHLVELCEKKTPTYFVPSCGSVVSGEEIHHFDIHQKAMRTTKGYLSTILDKVSRGEKPNILLVAGASCPDIVMENVLEKLIGFIPYAEMPEDILA